MGIEALKAQLKEAEITKEQYIEELKKLLDNGSITQEQHDEAANVEDKPLTPAEIQAMIQLESQKAADKVRTEYTRKLKLEQAEKERLLKEKMSDEDKLKFEKEKFENELKAREDRINAREVELHIIDKLTEAKLPISFKPFLISDTKENAEKNVQAFADAWKAELKAVVDAKFKENGGTPPKGGGGGTPPVKNPFSKEHFNLTKQAEILKNDPELAKQLQAQA